MASGQPHMTEPGQFDFLSKTWYTIGEAFTEGMKSGLMETEDKQKSVLLLTIIPTINLGNKYGHPVGGECIVAAFSTKNRARTYLENYIKDRGQNDIIHWSDDVSDDMSEDFAYLEDRETGEYAQVLLRAYPLNKKSNRKF